MMPVAILAGGLATRLRPLTETIPKALIDIAGRPFLDYQLRLLRSKGITEVVLCVGYCGEQIREYADDGSRFGLHIRYSFDGSRLLGTAGAVRRALPLLGPQFFVLYGDSYLPCDYENVERRFLRSGKLGLMTVFRNEGNWDASNVEFARGRILKYSKVEPSPSMHHIDYGLGAFRHTALQGVPSEKAFDLASVYQDLLHRGELAACRIGQRFYEVGSTQGIVQFSEFVSNSGTNNDI
ncbi:MAG: nucleotidyltransferase family protein [Bryobacteraceae bacterium]|jgi:MurNAc alpha-1-phosphate uridylyltransferase